MAIAYVTSGKNNGGGATISASVNATGGDMAIIFVEWSNAGAFSSLLVNGSSTGVTQIGSEYVLGTNKLARTYYLANPPQSAVNYTITQTVADGVAIQVLIYSGASATQADSNATGTATGNLTLSTTVVLSNCWLVSTAFSSSTTLAPSTGTTKRTSIADLADGSGECMAGDSNGTVLTGSRSMAYTATGGTTNGHIISLAPGNTVYTINADVGAFILTGLDAGLLRPIINLVASVGAFTLTGQDSLFNRVVNIVADVGAFILTGIETALDFSGWSNQTKNTSSFDNESKHTSNWNNQNKS